MKPFRNDRAAIYCVDPPQLSPSFLFSLLRERESFHTVSINFSVKRMTSARSSTKVFILFLLASLWG